MQLEERLGDFAWCGLAPRRGGRSGKADLREETVNLLQASADAVRIAGGQVVEGDGEEGVHHRGCSLQRSSVGIEEEGDERAWELRV